MVLFCFDNTAHMPPVVLTILIHEGQFSSMTFHDFYFQLHFGRLAKMPPVGGFFADVTFQVLLLGLIMRVVRPCGCTEITRYIVLHLSSSLYTESPHTCLRLFSQFTISTRVFFDKHPPYYSLQTSMVLFCIYRTTAHMPPVVFTIHIHDNSHP